MQMQSQTQRGGILTQPTVSVACPVPSYLTMSLPSASLILNVKPLIGLSLLKAEEEARRLMTKLDKDGDDQISFDEFVE